MINSITFDNFRGLKHLELPELSRITLLTGRNNAGKSSILEGIFTLLQRDSPETFKIMRNLRGLATTSAVNAWEQLFYKMDTSQTLQISASINHTNLYLSFCRDDSFVPNSSTMTNLTQDVPVLISDETNYGLKFVLSQNNYHKEGHFYSPSPNTLNQVVDFEKGEQALIYNHYFLLRAYSSAQLDDLRLTTWFGNVDIRDERQSLIEHLKVVEPDILEIRTIVQDNHPQLYIKTKNSILPVKLSGDGLCRLLYFTLTIARYSGSLIMIDEVESGFHYSMQKEFWRIFAEIAKENNCQIIATTHSYECIQNAVDGIGEAGMEDEFCLYRVEHEDGENRAFRLNGELTRFSIDKNMEVR